MKQLIKDVLADVAIGQPNLASEACQENIATLIIVAIKTRGWFLDLSTLDGKIKLTENELKYVETGK
jgi:hypothetical protein